MVFLLYTVEFLAIARRHGSDAQFYADGTQLYRHFSANVCDASVSATISCFIAAVNRLITSNRLKINKNKTDFFLLGTRLQLENVNLRIIILNSLDVPVSITATWIRSSSTTTSHSLYTLSAWLDGAFVIVVSSHSYCRGGNGTSPRLRHPPRV